MADPKGFLKVTERQTAERRPVAIRIRDWNEVYEKRDPAVLQSRRVAAWIAEFRSATKVVHSETSSQNGTT